MLETESRKLYDIAVRAREKGLDAATQVEINLATDIAGRVEGLVGPKGVADRIRELLTQKNREETALELVKDIMGGRFGKHAKPEEAIEQCVRTGVTILTEGVTAAGTEGISKAKILENRDGTRGIAIFFAGPIRAAGGTAAAQALVIADLAQKLAGLQGYKATDEEVDRYVEEIEICQALLGPRQYRITEPEIRQIMQNCPVLVEGEPTEDAEVSVYKNTPRLETNRVRGGMVLVMAEGLGLKAAKISKFCKKHGINWDWLEGLIKVAKASAATTESDKTKPLDRYLNDIVGGRPIFSYPSAFGGFRLRYGRARNTGINGKGIHPSAMYILDEFIAIGTQLKMERPGKSAVMMPVDTIEPPIVLLENGDVVQLDTPEKAQRLRAQTKEILFLGDILIAYGDFSKANQTLLPPGFCEEQWVLALAEKNIQADNAYKVSVQDAVEMSETHKIPLHPKYTHFYSVLAKEELLELAEAVSTGKLEQINGFGEQTTSRLVLKKTPVKRLLEKACIPHKTMADQIVIDDGLAIYKTLDYTRLLENSKTNNDILTIINTNASFPIADKTGTFIGTRMGRPEKAKERLMSPAPHGLFPVADYGGKRTRSNRSSKTQVRTMR